MSPDGGKKGRAHAASAQVESGQVFLPGASNPDGTGYNPANTPAETQELVAELAVFPDDNVHDDQVDAMSYALNYLATRDGRGAWNLS